jgi:hypothetical protein
VGQRQATLGHHLHEIAQAELDAQGSSHAQLAHGTGPECPAGDARRRWPAGRLRAYRTAKHDTPGGNIRQADPLQLRSPPMHSCQGNAS